MNGVEHLFLLAEEPSMGAFLRELLPRMLGNTSFEVVEFQGKSDLLRRLPNLLRGYAAWMPTTHRILVIVDQDDDDCLELKARLEQSARNAGLVTRTHSVGGSFAVVNRIAIEELEAWYFGDWDTVCACYPGVSKRIPRQRAYRDSDAIRGGTWEAFERALQRAGYYDSGLLKIDAARRLGQAIDPTRNQSKSFQHFAQVIETFRS